MLDIVESLLPYLARRTLRLSLFDPAVQILREALSIQAECSGVRTALVPSLD